MKFVICREAIASRLLLFQAGVALRLTWTLLSQNLRQKFNA